MQIASAMQQDNVMLYKKLIRRWDSERELFYDDIFNHFYAVRPEATEMYEIMQNKGYYVV